jgi:hypothetical protein
MKKRYDFSGAEQGRFYRSPRSLHIPIYLDRDIEKELMKRKTDRRNMTKVVNSILREKLKAG